MDADHDWKKSVGFPINYSSDNSDSDLDSRDVVLRRRGARGVRRPEGREGRLTELMLHDEGDGSEADLLGSTPPRARIRDKQKRKTVMDAELSPRAPKDAARDAAAAAISRRARVAPGLKLQRARDRDWKAGGGARADSMPSPTPAPPAPAPPTLVESCSRFMSLTSRLKSRVGGGEGAGAAAEEEAGDEAAGAGAGAGRRAHAGLPASRVTFHNTFSMLINMGSGDKGPRRMISREEVVWQNELKDLIWLELTARVAGLSLPAQDAALCQQRRLVPAILTNITNYRFVNPEPCGAWGAAADADEPPGAWCGALTCGRCARAVGKALREARVLLDSYHNALALYQSGRALTHDHPLVATALFQNRLKALCLWYNTAMHMRLKMIAVRRMIRTIKQKQARRERGAAPDHSRQSSVESSRPSQVRFDTSITPSSSSTSHRSDASHASHASHADRQTAHADDKKLSSDTDGSVNSDNKPPEEHETEHDGAAAGEAKTDEEAAAARRPHDAADEPLTPEIVLDSRYATADSAEGGGGGGTAASSESGYASDGDAIELGLGALDEIAELRLLGRAPVSIFRSYHQEMLKTQGVRRCFLFINKMRCNLLQKVYLTLERPDDADIAEEGDEEAERAYELKRFGCLSAESAAMRLPSYRSHFLLLGTVCLEAIHDYLALRLEDRPDNPCCLTVKQLMHELKEGLDIAADMRVAFARHIQAALRGAPAPPALRRDLLLVIRTFDATVDTVFEQYLSYLRTMSLVEPLGRVLAAEWEFTARLARRAPRAAARAPAAFAEIACNQLNRVREQFEKKFKHLEEVMEKQEKTSRHFVYTICRATQEVYASERESTLQAAHWARLLAARLARAAPAHRPERAAIAESLLSIRSLVAEHTRQIEQRSRAADRADERDEPLVARVRELMLQIYRLGFELHRELYKLAMAPFQPEQDARRRPVSLQPARAPHAGQGRRRPETIMIHHSANPLIHKELHKLVGELGGGGGGGGGRAPAGGRRAARGGGGADDAPDDSLLDHLAADQSQSSIELFLEDSADRGSWRGAEGGAEGEAEAEAAAEAEALARRVARAVIEFAQCWMAFVVERCEKGRGLRPRWACQGLEFLMLACDPSNTRHLSDAEFEQLKHQMDGCISHVIGARPPAPRAEPDHPAPPRRRAPAAARVQSPRPLSPAGAGGGGGGGGETPAPPTPPAEPEPLFHLPGVDNAGFSARVYAATRRLDLAREERLRAARALGSVRDAAVAAYEPKLRQLQFNWQRGLKIGAGSFGKVYTVVNTQTGQLLAMKEVALGAGDRRALQRAANELRVLEGVIHPHLVRYYGCELHREEMLLFMELCVEGSLEALLARTGALAETAVRRYTKQLLSAVTELHARAIAHRDIKSGNIFLTNDGHCLKLGDFGCAVKIRANTTAAGELVGHVGTQAYMAPEVFMKPTGHGRAADVWSLGCVVTEMGSGQRPFAEYDSNVQIMFVVGMGKRPAIPSTLSAEGQAFCRAALTHEPEHRPTAEQLSLHHFLMLESDDECQCEPAFLIT